MDTWIGIAAIGAGATAGMDLWMVVRRRLLGTPPPDYAMVGRWLGHLARGRFRHDRIAKAPPVVAERAQGWIAHYATGIAFAALLVAVAGRDWLRQPTLLPALLAGIGTVLAPFLLMQPGMGAGFFASRTPRPNVARRQSLVTHSVFGLGLYAAALVLSSR